MPHTVQETYAAATDKAAADLAAAYAKLPEDKRDWSPALMARTAADQLAECVMINNSSVPVLRDHAFPADFDMAAWFEEKSRLAAMPWPELGSLLRSSAEAMADATRALSDSDLDVSVDLPWGPMTLMQIAANAPWNMSYHEAQINYIGSILGL